MFMQNIDYCDTTYCYIPTAVGRRGEEEEEESDDDSKEENSGNIRC
jgi:hypothetical protein